MAQLLMMLKDKSTSWVKLKDLKVSNPLELAEYAVVNQIMEELAFKWWVSNTLCKWNHIIFKVKKKYWQTMHKFGCKLPHLVEEVLEIDRQMGMVESFEQGDGKDKGSVECPLMI